MPSFESYIIQDHKAIHVLTGIVFDHSFNDSKEPLPLEVRTVLFPYLALSMNSFRSLIIWAVPLLSSGSALSDGCHLISTGDKRTLLISQLTTWTLKSIPVFKFFKRGDLFGGSLYLSWEYKTTYVQLLHYKSKPQDQTPQIWIPALQFTSCVNLGQLLTFLRLSFLISVVELMVVPDTYTCCEDSINLCL